MSILLHKNESPYRALEAEEIGQIAIDTKFNRYGMSEYERFVNAYANFRDLDPELISLANGSDEWLQKLMILFGQKGPVLALEADFFMYQAYANQLNSEFMTIPVRADFTYDYEGVYAKIKHEKPALFLFSQPNNPFGYLHPTEFIEKASALMAEVGGHIVIDEAYAEFAEPLPAYSKGDHVIIIRTLSKAYGLAGLRIGIANSSPTTMKILNSIEHPYPVNNLSLNLASFLLDQPGRTQKFIETNRQLATDLQTIFEDEVADIVKFLPSVTNFLFTYGEAAESLGEWVSNHGFIIRRYQDTKEPLPLRQAVRYSIGTPEEMAQLRQVIIDWRDRQWQTTKNA